MKHDDSAKDPDEPLDAVLRGWKVDSALPPRFQEQVWRRIARAEADGKDVVWSGLSWRLHLCMPHASRFTVRHLVGDGPPDTDKH